MTKRTVTIFLAALASLMLDVGTEAAAQTVRTGSINGTVKDESNAALPGVAVSVTGPVLQVSRLVQVTGPTGDYLVPDLPPGTYQVTFDLAGFTKVIRENVVLTTGFAARVDAMLKVASIAEAVTVTAQSPLVDIQNTRGGGTVNEAVLNAIPNNRNYQDIMNLTPGMVTTTPPQSGVIGMKGEANGFKNYGAMLSGQERTSIEGIDMQSNENPDFSTVEEVDAKTYGNTAEVSTPGAALQLIVKSGGNTFHGRYQGQYMTDKLQSNNVDAALQAQGIAAGDTAVYYTDFAGDLGGRIIRDRLWFYGALRSKNSERTLPGYSSAPGPDGVYGTKDDIPGHPVVLEKDQMIKMSWQPTRNNKLIGFYSRNKWDEKQYLAQAVSTARFIPEEATPYLRYYNYQSKGEWQGTLGNRLFASVMFGNGWYVADYTNDCNVPDRPVCRTPPPPAAIDLATQIQTGTPFVNGLFHRPRDRYQLNGTLSYSPDRFLGGSHEFRVGYMTWWQRLELQIPDRGAAGNYQLVFDNGAPSELVTTNFPVDGRTALNTYAGFVQDTWRVTRRLTANLGLRLERSVAWVPPQTKAQGVFGTSGSFAQIDGGSWFVPAPRFGLAFDLAGDGKTVIKATYGRYNHDMGDGFANAYNPNTQTNTTYRWHDVNGDKLYETGEVNLNPNGPDFVSVTGGSTMIPNLALRDPHTNEATGSIEHEFPGFVSMRGLWVFKETVNDYQAVNIAIPFSAWSIPVVRKDPGPDGIYGTADDGGYVTLHDFTPDYRGSQFVVNEYENRPPGQNDHYNSFELTLNKRAAAGRWFGSTSFLATKNHRFIIGIPQNPNQQLFDLDSTWDWTYRLSGSYRLPYGVSLSGLYTLMRGIPGQRTYVFRAADPNGGLPLRQVGNLTVPLEAFGTERGPVRPNLNFRVSRMLILPRNLRLSLDVDVLNVLNSNPSWATSYASGPTYGFVTSIQPPRIARIGLAFEF
jgi:hypothetical protein